MPKPTGLSIFCTDLLDIRLTTISLILGEVPLVTDLRRAFFINAASKCTLLRAAFVIDFLTTLEASVLASPERPATSGAPITIPAR